MVVYVFNWFIGSGFWWLMLGVEILLAFVFVLFILKVFCSLCWLVVKWDVYDEALEVLQCINLEIVKQELVFIEYVYENVWAGGFRVFLLGIYNCFILFVFLFVFFNQVFGINVVIYYVLCIFKLVGLEESVVLLVSIGIGMVNFVFIFIGMLFIDGFGCCKLMYIGFLGYIILLFVVVYVFYSGVFGGYMVLFWLFVFIVFYVIGQGVVIWVFIFEIFFNEVCSFGNFLGSGIYWVFVAFIVGMFFYLIGVMEEFVIFGFFVGFMVL